MVPILLCLGTWGWSRSHDMWIKYCHHERFVACRLLSGNVDVGWGTLSGEADGWEWETWPGIYARFWPFHPRVNYFGGFVYFHESITTNTLHLLQAPWWFLILVFSAILYVVWRKTRPRGTGRAFPVELTAPQSEPTDATS